MYHPVENAPLSGPLLRPLHQILPIQNNTTKKKDGDMYNRRKTSTASNGRKRTSDRERCNVLNHRRNSFGIWM